MDMKQDRAQITTKIDRIKLTKLRLHLLQNNIKLRYWLESKIDEIVGNEEMAVTINSENINNSMEEIYY